MDQHAKKRFLIAVAVLIGLAVVVGITIWCKMYRVVPQPAWITADQRDNYFYGSIGAGQTAGLPYWVWLEMPRMFAALVLLALAGILINYGLEALGRLILRQRGGA